ncbi:hypothetical protein SPBRAN_1130 [uncultured Candidatus Thioglobus sp.]|nr:hypothetical protein SPBRAN_1130 [uncultured Candidatus Thioglobus sp.]
MYQAESLAVTSRGLGDQQNLESLLYPQLRLVHEQFFAGIVLIDFRKIP